MSKLPGHLSASLGLADDATPQSALALVEQRVKTAKDKLASLPSANPQVPKFRKDLQQCEPLLAELREIIYGDRIDASCERIDKLLSDKPDNWRASARELLRQARNDLKNLPPGSDYYFQVESREKMLAQAPSLAAPHSEPVPSSPPPVAPESVPQPVEPSTHRDEVSRQSSSLPPILPEETLTVAAPNLETVPSPLPPLLAPEFTSPSSIAPSASDQAVFYQPPLPPLLEEVGNQPARKKSRTGAKVLLAVSVVIILGVLELVFNWRHRSLAAQALQQGDDYLNGTNGVAQDYTQAMNWYQKAAKAGNSEAMNNIGDLYYYGSGVAQDYAQAMNWYQKGAAAGGADAMNNIGWLYHSGLGVDKDYVHATSWYQKSAVAGNSNAMNRVGFSYENGEGVTQDYAQALTWYRKGAGAGDSDAMYNTGRFYYNGFGVDKDNTQAMNWYQKGAAAGSSEAMNNIGYFYEKGFGADKDYAQAMSWYQKGAAAGSSEAMNNVGALYGNGFGVAQDYAQAMSWYQKGAAAGSSEAMNNIGEIYENGWGVPQDQAQAIQWYRKAATLGNDNAKSSLTRLGQSL